MDEKLTKFFNKIDFSYTEEFNKVKIEKVLVDQEDLSWDIYLNCEEILDYEAFNNLIKKCEEGIEGVNKINLVCLVPTINENDLSKTIITLSKL